MGKQRCQPNTVMNSHIGNQDSDYIANQGGISHIREPGMVLLWLMMPTWLLRLNSAEYPKYHYTLRLPHADSIPWPSHCAAIFSETKHAVLEKSLMRLSSKRGFCKSQKENNQQIFRKSLKLTGFMRPLTKLYK